jgi:hypothetical protein
MAYIFVSDGRPEADEYGNNRIWFDERDPADRRRALLEAQRRREYIARRAERAGEPGDAALPLRLVRQ